MPSTTLRVVSVDLASSTVITPSLPTLSIASAIWSPIALSLLAAIVATCDISFLSLPIGLDIFFNCSNTSSTALSIPRFRAMGLAPAVTFLRPSLYMASVRSVAVVVPSPALSEVLLATSFTISAPMFSNGSASSISLATVTPSLVIVGDPNFLSSTTLRPFGPRVTFTALESCSTPESILRLASSLYSNCFATFCSLPCYLTTANISDSLRMSNSSSLYLISVPP